MKLTNVMAMSLDGAVAAGREEPDSQRQRYRFGVDEDKRHVEGLLAQADAVIVGGRTLRARGGAWEVPGPHGRFPRWVVLTESGLDPSLPFWGQTHIERWVVTPGLSGKERTPIGQENLRQLSYGDQDPAVWTYEALEASDCQTVLLFGGGEINWIFYAAGLVDELKLTLCPTILGCSTGVPLVRPPLPAPVDFTLESSQVKSDLVFLSYKVQKA